ncbi:putative peptidyl-tRNA hydrolase PTRHD1 [Hylaeus volcanicus]|uniref:putative peptidyl-tRNA hydrolase PTRHD1 n=1 Tax=Hylaeus volcanicus TaxID=313075 RepID=UPI0023B86A33|nr:putative peptidyl-tRNA hydrolase PTRHD1 [Hylaeus volcanicus]
MASSETIVQYIVIRSDLTKEFQWSLGAVMAQACHASCAAIHTYYKDPFVQDYLKQFQLMHKIILQVPDENALRSLATKLADNDIKFWLWEEKPENVATCLASKPGPRSTLKNHFRSLKLL